MRFERLDLNLLVALDTLLQEQNVSGAAERMCLSQSAMSGALNRLREYFDDEILTIVGRRMVLTPRAQQLVEPVRNALLLIKTTITTKPEFDPGSSTRRFKIVCSDYVCDVLLGPAWREISAEAPGLTFELSMPDAEMFISLERGDVDLILLIDRYLSPHHPMQILFEEEHAVLAWSEHPALKHGLSEADYFALPHIATRFGRSRDPAFIERFFAEQGDRRRVEVAVPSFSMVPSVLVGTNRITTMLRRHAEYFARLLPLTVHPMPIEIPHVREAAQWHGLKGHDQALMWVVDRLRRHASKNLSTLSLAA